MASREVTITEWECDACDATHSTKDKSKAIPAGWNDEISINLPGGMSSQGIVVCGKCAKDKTAAAEAAMAKWNRLGN